jgi:VanZ family protein
VGIGKTHLFNSLTAQQLNSLTLLLMTMAFALSDEIHQLFVPGRAFQVIDLIIDFLGLLFGVYLYQRLKIEPQR